MEYALMEKYDLIIKEMKKEISKNPIQIVKRIMLKDFINIHGPEHHFLDGIAFLVAYNNAGGKIDLESAFQELKKRTIKMPGAMCGHWGICGSVASIGAALSILHETGPLSNDDFYKDHMEYTSSVINEMSKIGGPRCCKRNAFLSISRAVQFVYEKYNIQMDIDEIQCEFTDWNQQCIKTRCPFYKKR